MSGCFLCPRGCGVDRVGGELGLCGADGNIRIAKIMLHSWEEPCICNGAGAGAIFFSGCNLHCIYCQNRDISYNACGEIYSPDSLAHKMLSLQEQGASCIDLVTPTHYSDVLADVLRSVRPKLNIPVVWNSSGYENVETLSLLRGLVDIYMPDLKYFSSEISEAYSEAPDYFEIALPAIKEMLSQVGVPRYDGDRLLSGVIVRHLVLPSHRKDSEQLLRALCDALGSPSDVILSLMSQYTPDFYIQSKNTSHKELTRRLTTFEYNKVLQLALSLGFDGYLQDISSASKRYTPDFK